MSSWQDWSQQVAAQIRAAYRDETGQINPASMAIQHTVLFKFPELKDEAPLQAVVEQFNALEGIKVQFTAHGTATQNKKDALSTLNWPDKTDGYTHCLFVIAEDPEALKTYLHSDAHLKDWMAAVKPWIKGIVVFDSRLKVPLDPATHAQLHPVLFRLKDSVNAGELQLHVEKFNGLDGISASLEPFLGQTFLDLVSWPDKSEGFNWCLTVLARDADALKNYLHSEEHKAWAASAGPHVDASRGPPLLVFDVPLRLKR